MISETYNTFRAQFGLLTRDQKKGAVMCLGVMLCLALTEIAAAGLIVSMARMLTTPGKESLLVPMALGCVVVFVFKAGMALLDSRTQSRWIQAVVLDFKMRLIRRYTKMDYARQIMMNSGQSLSVLYNDVDTWLRVGLSSLGIMLSEACVFVILMGFLLTLQPGITGVLLALFGGMGFLFVRYLAPSFKKWGRGIHDTAQKGYNQALQILQSYKDILIFGKTDYFVTQYQEQSRLRAEIGVKSAVAQVIPRITIETTFIFFFAGVVIAFSLIGGSIQDLTVLLSAYLYAGFRMLPGLNRVLIQLSNVRLAEASVQRIVNELQSPGHESIYLSTPDLTFRNTINVENLSYRYPSAEGDTLVNANFVVNKGEFIGIIGETGSGKSTLLHLMLGLLSPTAGQVRIDGRYPAQSREWHAKVGYAAQNFHLIDGSIADNIAFGVAKEDRDAVLLQSAIHDAQLEQFLSRLPQGLDTQIGEKGALISGGERQRIALARALYRKPEILMLDEATSALDLETEASIMQAIAKLKDRGMTLVAVTHRLDTLRIADRVLTMEKGRIVRDEPFKQPIKQQVMQ